MNPISTDVAAAAVAQPEPRASFSCDRHLDEVFTGFCPSCLCERLATLDQSSTNTPSSSRRPSSASASAAAAIKSFFTSASKATNSLPPQPPLPKATKQAPFFSQLRRTKSFSASVNEALGLSFEPQRKSCDVRVRTTLSTLIRLDNENNSGASGYRVSSVPPSVPSSSRQHQQNSQRIEPSAVGKIVFEEKDKGLRARENAEKSEIVCDDDSDSNGDEIRPDRDSRLENLRNLDEAVVNSGEIAVEKPANVVNLKPLKDHIDVDAQEKKTMGGGFWAKASVFSNKWHKWRRKKKRKKENNGATLPVERPISRHYRETQSEVAEYGFGRRSWDTDPRFSLDAARISFDDARYSLDEPRASWDGYLGGRSFPKMAPMVSVMEDAPAVQVPRLDIQILVEEPLANCVNVADDDVPGGSVQTREYYSDSSSRRRKSLDRSSSTRKTVAAALVEIDDLKTSSNAKVSPSVGDAVGERDLRDSTSHSLRDDGSETVELGSVIRDGSNTLMGNGEKKEPKKSKKWSFRFWSFIQRLNVVNKDEEDEKHSRVDGVSRSYSASWQHSMREANSDSRSSVNKNMYRSSSMSWRNANQSLPGGRKHGVDANGPGKKGKGEFVLERNRSARYSPNFVNNGLLRLYLAPLRSSRRGGFGNI